MRVIGDVLVRNLQQKIEEIIKVDQTDEQSVYTEITEYVATDRIKNQYRHLFEAQVADRQVSQLVDFINVRIPTEVIMFDVSVDRAVKRSTERIAEIMYTVLLRELDYAEDFDIAELEFELEGEGKLEEFTTRCLNMYHEEWRRVRKGALKISRASAILHSIDPATFPAPETWAQSLRNKS